MKETYMHDNKNMISLKHFQDKDVEVILDESILNNVQLFFLNNESDNFQQLTIGQINKIRSEHPAKVKICFRQNHYDFSDIAMGGHFQDLNYADLWADKSVIARLLDNINLLKKDIHEIDSSAYKMLYAAAIDKYGYDPSKSRNTATGKSNHSFQASVEAIGLTIDEGTVLTQLQKAVDLYPEVVEILKNRKK